MRLPSSVQLRINPPSSQSMSANAAQRRPISENWRDNRYGYQPPETSISKLPTRPGAQKNQTQQRMRMMTPSVSISPVVSKKDEMEEEDEEEEEEEVEHLEYYTDSEFSDAEAEAEGATQENEQISPMPDSATKVPGQKQKGKDVVTISSSSESSDDDCIVLSDEGDDDTVDEDPSNSGMHTNDRYNIPDEQGRVLGTYCKFLLSIN